MTLYTARCRSCGWKIPEAPLGQATAAAILHTEASSKEGVFSPRLRRGHSVLVEWGDRRSQGARYVIRGFFRLPAFTQAGPDTLPETETSRKGPNSR